MKNFEENKNNNNSNSNTNITNNNNNNEIIQNFPTNKIPFEIFVLKNYFKTSEEVINKLEFPIIEQEKEQEQESNKNKNSELNKNQQNKIQYEIKEIILIRNFLPCEEINNFLKYEKFYLKNLKSLNLSANELTKIPIEINNLFNLEDLILNNNKINFLENFQNLKKLKNFQIKSNKIKKIENFKENKNLQKISFSSNSIFEINFDEFSCEENLEEFFLFGNYLGCELDDEKNKKIFEDFLFGLKKFKKLRTLYIGGNHFNLLDEEYFIKKVKEIGLESLRNFDGKLFE